MINDEVSYKIIMVLLAFYQVFSLMRDICNFKLMNNFMIFHIINMYYQEPNNKDVSGTHGYGSMVGAFMH